MQVTNGKKTILNRAYVASPTYNAISDSQIGSDGTAEVENDEYLGYSLGDYSFLATYPVADTNNRKVTARVYIDTATLNGESLKECGLFASDDVMICRNTFTTINKTSSYQISFIWSWVIN